MSRLLRSLERDGLVAVEPTPETGGYAATSLYRNSGYTEVPAFNDAWFGKRLAPSD